MGGIRGVVCPHCGAGVPAPTNVTLTDSHFEGNGMNVATACPGCGRPVDLAPGESVRIDLKDGRIDVLQVLGRLQRKELEALRELARDAASGPVEADVDAIGRVAPEIGHWLKSSDNREELRKNITLLLGLLTFLLTAFGVYEDRRQPPTFPAPAPTVIVQIENERPTDGPTR